MNEDALNPALFELVQGPTVIIPEKDKSVIPPRLELKPLGAPLGFLPDKWKDPTPEMRADPLFDKIWQVIKTWDINVPNVYRGYCGATGNHVAAIYEGIMGDYLTTQALDSTQLDERDFQEGT